MNVTISFDPSVEEEVQQALSIVSTARPDMVVHALEDPGPTPAPAPAPAAAPEPAAAPAPAAETTDYYALIKDKVNEIGTKDKSKLSDVKAALNNIGVEKIGGLTADQYPAFYEAIKGLV